MKKVCFIALALCFSSLFSQQSQLRFNYTRSIPLGDFKNGLSKTYGSVLTGFALGISYARKVNNSFSIVMSYQSMNNGINTVPLARNLLVEDPNERFGDIRSEGWKTKSFLIGGEFSFPIAESQFAWHVETLLGVGYVESPIVLVYYRRDAINNNSLEKQSDQSISFAYQFGAGVDYIYSKKFRISCGVNYFETKTSFKDIKVLRTRVNEPGAIVERASLNHKIKLLTSSIELGFTL